MASRAVGYAVKVKPLKIRETTQGGIILADQTRDLEEGAVNVGIVLQIGSTAFHDWADKEEVQVGDIVRFRPYSGRLEKDRDGTKYRVIHYDDIFEVKDPADIEDIYEEIE